MGTAPAIAVKEPKLPPLVKQEYDALAKLTTAKLRQELNRSLHLTAAHLRRLAVIVRLLEERNEDLSGLRIGILPYLRQIAYGQILPEIITSFGGAPLLLGALSQIPLAQQKRLVDKGTVDVVTRDSRGEMTVKQFETSYLTGPQIRQVFADTGIRTVEEQKQYLEGQPPLFVSSYTRKQGAPSGSTEIRISLGNPEYKKLSEASVRRKMTIEEVVRLALQECDFI